MLISNKPKQVIFKLLVLFGCALIFNSCSKEDYQELFGRIVYDEDNKEPLVSFLYAPQDSTNVAYNIHIKKTVNYTKIPYSVLNYKQLNNSLKLSQTTKVLVITNTKVLNNKAFEHIVAFIDAGGTVFLPFINKDYKYRYLAGLNPNTNPNNLSYAQGYRFTTDFIPALKNKTYPGYSGHEGFSASNYNEKTTVLATAITPSNYPTILEHKIGKGKVIVFNSKQPATKQDRGLYFSAILSGLEGVPYPIVNASTIYLDDFPAPTYTIKKEPILSEYNATHRDFYDTIWWPDMITLANDLNLKYTVMVCFDYSNNTKPPFLFNEWNNSVTKINNNKVISGDYTIASALKEKHEMALHGFNHTSLLETDWPNQNYMESSLKAVAKKWKLDNYGKLPVTYVPPSNHIDKMGFDALHKGMPSIKYNCSLYLGEFKDGGGREYDYEPLNNSIFNFPRITSGYVLDDEEKFNLYSLFMYTGIWSHFIHPDDVYQIKDGSNKASAGKYEYRNKHNLGWVTSANGSEGMLPRYKKLLQNIKHHYPLLRFIKNETAAKHTLNWRYANYEYAQNKNAYTITSANKKLKQLKQHYWFVYVSTKKQAIFEKQLHKKEVQFTHTPYMDGFMYTIATNTPFIEVGKLTTNPLNKKITNPWLPNVIATHKKESEKFDEDYNIDFFAENGRIDEAIDLLKIKIQRENGNSIADWNRLFKYLGWKNKQHNIWEVLNTQFLKTSSKKIIDLSIIYGRIIEYPSLKTRELWMKRQLKTYPNDIVLKSQYDYYFGTEKPDEEDFLHTASAKKILDTLQTGHIKNKVLALSILFDKKPKGFDAFLDKLEPCHNESITPIAENIAWFYADIRNYDKAIQWAKCTKNISTDDINYWRLSLGQYKFLKSENFPAYIAYLIENKSDEAISELENITPCTSNFPKDVMVNIAYTYVEKKNYTKALQWSECISDFDIKEQLLWCLQIDSNTLNCFNTKYESHKKAHPNDHKINLLAAQTYADYGFIKASWIIASTLPESGKRKRLKTQLNQDVQYITPEDQEFLLDNYIGFFETDVAKKIKRHIAVTQKPFIGTASNVITDPSYIISYNNTINYGFFSKKKHKHTFGITQSQLFPIQDFKETKTNSKRSLYGVSYGFKQRKKDNKAYYNFNIKLQQDTNKSVFHDSEFGIFWEKQKTYTFLIASHKPAITTASYSLKIYNSQLTFQHEYKWNKHIENTINFRGNYFTDAVFDANLLSTLSYRFKLNKHHSILPNIEGQGTLGTKDIPSGFPYWTNKQRFYAGGGLIYHFKNIAKDSEIAIGASFFNDTFSDSFNRFNANFRFPLHSYFFITGDAEFASIQNLFSNEFNIGLTYHFK